MKNWFAEKTAQIVVKEHNGQPKIFAYGIALDDIYGGQWFYDTMIRFCRDLAKNNLEYYVESMSYDTCYVLNIKFKNGCPREIEEKIGDIADKSFYGFVEIADKARGCDPRLWTYNNYDKDRVLEEVLLFLRAEKDRVFDNVIAEDGSEPPIVSVSPVVSNHPKEATKADQIALTPTEESTEVWKDIIEFRGYRISNFGRVFDIEANEILKIGLSASKKKDQRCHVYAKIKKYQNGRINIPVAKTVLAYHGEYKPDDFLKKSVGYKDDNPKNCNVNNLYWIEAPRRSKGGRAGQKVFVFMDDHCEAVFQSAKEASKKTNVSVYKIIHSLDTDTKFNGFSFRSSM